MASCCEGENEFHKEKKALQKWIERRSSNCFGVGCFEEALHGFIEKLQKLVTSDPLGVN